MTMKYKMQFITPKGNVLSNIDDTLNFVSYVMGNMEICSKCNLVVTDCVKNKIYDPIPVQNLIDLAHPDVDLDQVLLTNFYIGDDTEENTQISIETLYIFVGKLQLRMIRQAESLINHTLVNDIYHRQNTLNFFNRSIALNDDRQDNYIQPLNEEDLISFNFGVTDLPSSIQSEIEYLHINENENIIKKVSEWKDKESTVKAYVKSWLQGVAQRNHSKGETN